MDETGLVERVKGGDREAFGRLVGRYQKPIYQLCYRVTGSPSDAEELAHDAFVDAYLKLAQLRDPAKFGPWLRVLALNLCRMWYRRRQRETSLLPDDLPDPGPEPDGSLHARTMTGLSRLSAAHRMVLVLHYWEGLTYEETARFLGIPLGTVMSRLHRARRELKRLVEQIDEGQEDPMGPDESFTSEVEAEINLLLRLAGKQSEARERLSVILRRSPERLARLIQEADDETVVDDLALLLRSLRQPAMQAVLECYQSPEPRVRSRAVALLRRALASGKPSRTGIPHARIARLEAYLLLDTLFSAAMEPAAKASLLADLIDTGPDEPTILLLTNSLLCFPDQAFPLLLERFWQSPKPEALYRPPDTLYALCRTGTRFAQELLQPLRSADSRRQTLALEGAEALARSLTGSGLDLNQSPDDRVALEARFRRKWAPPLSRDRDPLVLQTLAAAVARFLNDERDPIREKALRILGTLRSDTHREQIAACARHSRPGTRLAALRALAEIGEPVSAPLLIDVARNGIDGERAVAAWALGRLKADHAVPLLLEMTGDQNREVRGAAVSALGEIGGDAARTGLEVMVRACEQYAGRSLRRIALRETGNKPMKPSPTRMEDRIRDGAEPPYYIALDAAIRGLPEPRSFGETELSRLLAQHCRDYASTRRYLVDEALMAREASIYRLTDLGEAVWRVERFIRDHYLSGESNST